MKLMMAKTIGKKNENAFLYRHNMLQIMTLVIIYFENVPNSDLTTCQNELEGLHTLKL